MPYPTDLYPKEIRSPDEKQDDLINLNVIQYVLEELIGSYAIQKPENVYSEE